MSLPVPRALRMLAVAVILATALTGLRATSPVDAKPIEGYPGYQPQTSCSPRPKPGTVMLSEHLLRKYKGTGSLGITRACSGSGVSEHKEGRAFDWALDARSGRDRGYARDFLRRLRSTDRWGNRNALARRMGIMYVIWNDHIWSASSGYRKRDYLHDSCKKLEKCAATLRHRDHMHLSLSRAAARGKTSWYVKRSTPRPSATPEPEPKPATSRDEKRDSGTKKRRPRLPAGVLDLRSKPFKALRVPVDGRTVETRFKLRKGVTYSLTAAGLYGYGDPHKVGDAACTWSKKDQAWVSTPPRRAKRRFGRLALSVNGRLPFGKACRASHTYRTHITPTKDQPLRLRLLTRGQSSKGRLTVVVGRKRAKVGSALPAYPRLAPAPTVTERRKGYGLIAETVSVPAADPDGNFTVGSVRPDVTYRVTVSGAVRLGGGVRSNGQCLSIGGSWYRSASVDRRVPGQDHGNLYVNGAPFEGRGSSGCASRTHSTDLTPDAPGRMRLDLWDPLSRDDNAGELEVKVQRLTPIPTPTAPSAQRPRMRRTEWQQPRDWFEVNPRSKTGTLSTIKLRKGVPAQIFVRGRYTSTGVTADASCVRTSAGWTQGLPDGVSQDPLNVWVDDQAVRWRALGPKDGCASEYRYTTRFTPTRNGPIRLSVFDLDHRDNKGGLEVTVLREPR